VQPIVAVRNGTEFPSGDQFPTKPFAVERMMCSLRYSAQPVRTGGQPALWNPGSENMPAADGFELAAPPLALPTVAPDLAFPAPATTAESPQLAVEQQNWAQFEKQAASWEFWKRWWRRAALFATALLAGTVAYVSLLAPPSDLDNSPAAQAIQYLHVQKAQIAVLAPNGAPRILQKLELTPADCELPVNKPELSDRAFVIYLYDCVAEDGDIVDVYFDGQKVETVPLWHSPHAVRIPAQGNSATTLKIVGVHDGGGGVTTGIRTNTGDHITRSLAEGESLEITVVAQGN
jgi:hypothetical protein